MWEFVTVRQGRISLADFNSGNGGTIKMSSTTRSTRRAPQASNAGPRPERRSVEDVNKPRENQDPSSRRETSQPKDTENPPNENLQKHPDEAYGDTEIPSAHRRR
jgi:hypothetical protein